MAKYSDESSDILTSNTVEAKVGLLRVGEQLSGQSTRWYKKAGEKNPDGDAKYLTIFWNGYFFKQSSPLCSCKRKC